MMAENPVNVENAENPQNPPAKMTKEMEQNLKDEIRRGFASQKYYTSAPRSKKFCGGFWSREIRQIFDQDGDRLLANLYYCNTCDEIIVTTAKGGTAKINRHVSDHSNAFTRIRRKEIAQTIVRAIFIGVQYGQLFDEDYVLSHMPKPKAEWYAFFLTVLFFQSQFVAENIL